MSACNFTNDARTKMEDLKHSYSYSLVSAVYHFGTSTDAGHYTAIVYNEHLNTWLECNDEIIR